MQMTLKLHKRTGIKETRGDRVFTIANTILLTMGVLCILYPLVFVASSSFSSPDDVMAGRVVLFPVNFSVAAYEAVFRYQRIWTGFANSLFYAVAGTIINVTMTLLAAYPLSRRDLCGRDLIMSLFLFTMLFSGGLIPVYMLVKQLGMMNTRWALIIPNALSVWNLLITVAYFRTSIPIELLEAAQIDGANDFQHFVKIVLPLSTPIVAVLCLFYAVGHWNQFFSALLYLGNADLFPLQLILREILIQNQLDESMLSDVAELARRASLRELIKYAVIVVASVPPLTIYPLVQRHFVKGIMLGAVKG